MQNHVTSWIESEETRGWGRICRLIYPAVVERKKRVRLLFFCESPHVSFNVWMDGSGGCDRTNLHLHPWSTQVCGLTRGNPTAGVFFLKHEQTQSSAIQTNASTNEHIMHTWRRSQPHFSLELSTALRNWWTSWDLLHNFEQVWLFRRRRTPEKTQTLSFFDRRFQAPS